jgi:hypothetical protein
MSMNHEKRINKLEENYPANVLPRIRLVTDETETLEDAFNLAGYSGKMDNFFIIQRAIIDPLPRE